RDRQALGQAPGDLARGVALVGLDPADGHLGAADALRQLRLGQIQGFAPPPNPVAEGSRPLHSHPSVTRRSESDAHWRLYCSSITRGCMAQLQIADCRLQIEPGALI